MRIKIFLLGLLAILGVSVASASGTEVRPGFKDSNFAEDSGYPHDLPSGWIYRLEEWGAGNKGYQLVDLNDESFFAGIGLVKNNHPKTLDPVDIADQALENLELTPEERASVVLLPRESFGKNGEYSIAGFWLHKKNGEENSKGPYMALLFFAYKGEPHYFFATDKDSEESLEISARALFKAIFEGEAPEAEAVKE